MAVFSASSWGYKGYSEYWLEDSNAWIYRHLHTAGGRMNELAERFRGPLGRGERSLMTRALHQSARELLLAESSDWPFIMKTGTMVPYAEKRVKQHIGRFTKLYETILQGTVDEAWLAEVERRDNIFSGMPCAAYYLSIPVKLKTSVSAKTSRSRAAAPTAPRAKEALASAAV